MKTMKRLSVILALLMLVCLIAGCKKDAPASPSPSGGAGRTISTDTDVSDVTESEKESDSTAAETDKTTDTDDATDTDETDESTDTEKPSDPTSVGEGIASLAKQLIGTTFQLGASGPDHFDNSGFVYYCCKQNGIVVPRLVGEMATAGSAVAFNELAPGDVLVFSADIGGDPSFEAIYVGNNCFVACFKPERPTNIQSIDSYWAERFITARRVG